LLLRRFGYILVLHIEAGVGYRRADVRVELPAIACSSWPVGGGDVTAEGDPLT
jgi:hypothetical protein